MDYLQSIVENWQQQMALVQKRPVYASLLSGNLPIAAYKGMAHESYHNIKLNSKILNYSTFFTRNEPLEFTKKLTQHSIAEMGHEQLALADLHYLGVDCQKVVDSNPLPSTIALTAYICYAVQFISPLSILGYIFHLEWLPTQLGGEFAKAFFKMGVPKEALTFLTDHMELDVGHNKIMKSYVNLMVTNQQQLDIVNQSVTNTCYLHGNLIEAAVENGLKVFA